MHFERLAGRNPTEMPHLNPGFDIESRDSNGALVRLIEVKSTRGPWSNAALSKVQFDRARREGSIYWLYVVERAEREDFKVYCIQDPARRVNQFIYDDGWRALHDEGAGNPAPNAAVSSIRDLPAEPRAEEELPDLNLDEY
jgi:hypothetical protein